MVALDDLDVPFVAQRLRDLAGDLRQQVDAQAHVAGAYDDGAAPGFGDRLQVVVRQAGCADHVHDARLRGLPGEGDGRCGRGEVDDRLRAAEGLVRIIGDRDAAFSTAQRGAQIAADPVVAGAFQRADKGQPSVLLDLVHQHPAHAARYARHHDARSVGHARLLASPAA